MMVLSRALSVQPLGNMWCISEKLGGLLHQTSAVDVAALHPKLAQMCSCDHTAMMMDNLLYTSFFPARGSRWMFMEIMPPRFTPNPTQLHSKSEVALPMLQHRLVLDVTHPLAIESLQNAERSAHGPANQQTWLLAANKFDRPLSFVLVVKTPGASV